MHRANWELYLHSFTLNLNITRLSRAAWLRGRSTKIYQVQEYLRDWRNSHKYLYVRQHRKVIHRWWLFLSVMNMKLKPLRLYLHWFLLRTWLYFKLISLWLHAFGCAIKFRQLRFPNCYFHGCNVWTSNSS